MSPYRRRLSYALDYGMMIECRVSDENYLRSDQVLSSTSFCCFFSLNRLVRGFHQCLGDYSNVQYYRF